MPKKNLQFQRTVAVPPPVEFDITRLDVGLVLDIDNRDAPIESATKAELVRFENRGVRKEYGRTNLGLAAPGRVIGLIEHKYTQSGITVTRLVRLVRMEDGSLSLDIFFGGWSAVADYPIIEDVYLSLVSMHGLLVMADGSRILKWEEELETEGYGHDFEADVFLEPGGPTETDPVTVSPGGVGIYTFHFSTRFRQVGSSSAEVRVEIHKRAAPGGDYVVIGGVNILMPAIETPPPEVETVRSLAISTEIQENEQVKMVIVGEVGEEEAGSVEFEPAASGASPNGPPVDPVVYTAPITGTDRWAVAWIPGDLNAGTEIESKLVGFAPDIQTVAAGVRRFNTLLPASSALEYIKVRHFITTNFSAQATADTTAGADSDDPGQDPIWVATKDWVGGDTFDYVYDVFIPALETVEVYFYSNDGSGWTLEDIEVHANPNAFELNYTGLVKTLTVAGLGSGDFFGMSPRRLPHLGEMLAREVNGTSTGSEYDVHPFNKVDGDPDFGVTYEVLTGAIESSTISMLSGDAPRARLIAAFADRLIAMRDGNDGQILAASADGDIETWSGVDTYSAALTDVISDPLDDLMGLAHLGPGIAVLFRKRSIFRVAETGNVDLPIANVMWIDSIGTESPFSIKLVYSGVMFLGHDKMVYLLSENGPTPVSAHVHDEMVELLGDEDLGLVDSAYDPVTMDYFLAIPTDDSGYCKQIWVFSVHQFVTTNRQIMQWRKITTNVERLGSIISLPSGALEPGFEY